jgi:hypothetical protein
MKESKLRATLFISVQSNEAERECDTYYDVGCVGWEFASVCARPPKQPIAARIASVEGSRSGGQGSAIMWSLGSYRSHQQGHLSAIPSSVHTKPTTMSSDEEDRRTRPQGTETSISRLEAEQAYSDDDEDAQDVNVGKSRDARREEEESDEEDDEEDGMCFLRRAFYAFAESFQTRGMHEARRGQVDRESVRSLLTRFRSETQEAKSQQVFGC